MARSKRGAVIIGDTRPSSHQSAGIADFSLSKRARAYAVTVVAGAMASSRSLRVSASAGRAGVRGQGVLVGGLRILVNDQARRREVPRDPRRQLRVGIGH